MSASTTKAKIARLEDRLSAITEELHLDATGAYGPYLHPDDRETMRAKATRLRDQIEALEKPKR